MGVLSIPSSEVNKTEKKLDNGFVPDFSAL
jgi:hypothetical protein